MKRSDLDTVTVLRIIDGKPDDWRTWTTDYIAGQMPDVPPKVILAKLEQLAGKGLVEYGVAVQGCWLTGAGKQLLAQAGD